MGVDNQSLEKDNSSKSSEEEKQNQDNAQQPIEANTQ